MQVSGRMVEDNGPETTVIEDKSSVMLERKVEVRKRYNSFSHKASKPIFVDSSTKRSYSAVKTNLEVTEDESSTLQELAHVNNLTSKLDVAISKLPRDFKLL